jgi:hypothetical protein
MSPQPQRETPLPPEPESQSSAPHRLTWIMAITSAILMVSIFCLMVGFYANRQAILEDVARTHFRAIMGTPMAVMTALAIVTLLRVTSGSLEFEAFGFKLKGASGPVVLWIVTYLACVAGMVALW